GLTLFSFRKFFLKLRSRSTSTCGLSPPRPLPLYRLQFLGLCHLLREGFLPLPVKLNDRLSLVKVVGIANDLHRDGFHPKGQSRLPTSVAADDGAVLLDDERHHYPMPSHAL